MLAYAGNALHVLVDGKKEAVSLWKLVSKLVSFLPERTLAVGKLVFDGAEAVARRGKLELRGLKGLWEERVSSTRKREK
jgi:hypothetical protein